MKNRYQHLIHTEKFLTEMLAQEVSMTRVETYRTLINFAKEFTWGTKDSSIEKSIKINNDTNSKDFQEHSILPISLEDLCDALQNRNSDKKTQTIPKELYQNTIWHHCLFFAQKSGLIPVRSIHYMNGDFEFKTRYVVNTSPEQPMYGDMPLKTLWSQINEFHQRQLLLAGQGTLYAQKCLDNLADPQISSVTDLPMSCLSLDRQLRAMYLSPEQTSIRNLEKHNILGRGNTQREATELSATTDQQWIFETIDSCNQMIHQVLLQPLIQEGIRNKYILCIPAKGFLEQLQRRHGLPLEGEEANREFQAMPLYDLLYINQRNILKKRCASLKERLTEDFLHLPIKKSNPNHIELLQSAWQEKKKDFSPTSKSSKLDATLAFLMEYSRLKEWLENSKETVSHNDRIQIDETLLTNHTKTQTLTSKQKNLIQETNPNQKIEISSLATDLAGNEHEEKAPGKDAHLLVRFLKNYSSIYRLHRHELILSDSFHKHEAEILICLVPFLKEGFQQEYPIRYLRAPPSKATQIFLLYNNMKNIVGALEVAFEKAMYKNDYRDFYILEYLQFGSVQNKAMKIPSRQAKNIQCLSKKFFRRKLKKAYRQKKENFGKKITREKYYQLIEEEIFGIVN